MKLLDSAQASALIQSGKPLLLAGDEAVLLGLPRGNWIAGTIPYFMTAEGGCQNREKVFVHEIPDVVLRAHIRAYNTSNISRVYSHGFDNGMSAVIVPALTDIHQTFANGAPQFPDFALVPLFGWIAGIHLSELGSTAPKVVDGSTGEVFTDQAIVMHMELRPGYYANVDIINLFEPGTGDQLTFPASGFSADRVFVNGVEQSFYEYMTKNEIDLRPPLVADYCGAHVNVSFQSLDHENKRVNFYAPVFENVVYRLAEPVADYVAEFGKQLGSRASSGLVFSCNCILNYLYAELEGKQTGAFAGPITFGEVAFQLLNQTLVYVDVAKL